MRRLLIAVWFALTIPLTPAVAAINPATFVIGYEDPSGNPSITSSASTASGLYQFLNGTWASELAACGCGTLAQYPTAGSAPASVQTAVFFTDYNANGLNDWTCDGCDAPLTAALAADGGLSAFSGSGSTNPADYASLDTTSGLSDYLASNVVGAGGGAVGGGGISVSAQADGIDGANGGTFSPFTYIWNAYQASIAQPLAESLAKVQGLVSPFTLKLLQLVMIVIAIGGYLGRFLFNSLTDRLIRIAFVVPLTAVGSDWYQNYVVNFFTGLATTFSQTIIGVTTANPAAGFDGVIHAFAANASNIHWSLASGMSYLFLTAGIILLSAAIIYIVTSLMFIVWIVSQAITSVLLVIGPIMILSLLFDYTRGWFDRWIAALLEMAVVTFAALLFSSITLSVIIGAFVQAVASGSASNDAYNLLGIALVALVLGMTVPAMWVILQFIAAGAGATSVAAAAGAMASRIGATIGAGLGAVAGGVGGGGVIAGAGLGARAGRNLTPRTT